MKIGPVVGKKELFIQLFLEHLTKRKDKIRSVTSHKVIDINWYFGESSKIRSG